MRKSSRVSTQTLLLKPLRLSPSSPIPWWFLNLFQPIQQLPILLLPSSLLLPPSLLLLIFLLELSPPLLLSIPTRLETKIFVIFVFLWACSLSNFIVVFIQCCKKKNIECNGKIPFSLHLAQCIYQDVVLSSKVLVPTKCICKAIDIRACLEIGGQG